MAGKKGEGSRTRNELNGAQKFQLWSLLVELREDFERGQTSIKEAAEIVSKKLGFQVSESTITVAVKQGIVSWKAGKGPVPKKRLEILEKRVEELEEIVLRLISEQTANNGKATEPVKKVSEEHAWVGK